MNTIIQDGAIERATEGLGISEIERSRAKELLRDEDRQHAENLVRALGLEAPRIMFTEIVYRGSATIEQKRQLLADGMNMSKITESCGMTLEVGGKKFQLTLGPCEADHDLGAELSNISNYTTKEQSARILQEMSYMIFCARSIYNTMVAENKNLWESACRYVDNDVAEQAMVGLCVDPLNTTLYIVRDWKRVGLFIRAV